MPIILKNVHAAGYTDPTPIQKGTIPLVMSGRDVLGCAQTGTGKTAAFALPILQHLADRPAGGPIRALILTPTRELALQIFESFEAYGSKLPLRCCVVFGGVNQNPQVDKLQKGVDILVATPGRLNDLIGQGFIDLSALEIFVLDEADRMLDMGFLPDVKRVIRQLPRKRQTLFFSATMPPAVEQLAMTILHDPKTVKVDPVTSTVDSIRQVVYLVDKVNKKHLLAHIVSQPEVQSALVFTRTKHGADRVVRELARAGVQSMSIHGDKSQAARQNALNSFKAGKIKVLIATDIAARGIDIVELSHVINYDLPQEPETYIHRIGRTGRAGLDGTAISFCCYEELEDLLAIEKHIGKQLTVENSLWPMEVFTSEPAEPRPPRDRNRSGGNRGSGSRGQGGGNRNGGSRNGGQSGGNRSGQGGNRSGGGQAGNRGNGGGNRGGQNGNRNSQNGGQAQPKKPAPRPSGEKPASQAKPAPAPKAAPAQKPAPAPKAAPKTAPAPKSETPAPQAAEAPKKRRFSLFRRKKTDDNNK